MVDICFWCRSSDLIGQLVDYVVSTWLSIGLTPRTLTTPVIRGFLRFWNMIPLYIRKHVVIGRFCQAECDFDDSINISKYQHMLLCQLEDSAIFPKPLQYICIKFKQNKTIRFRKFVPFRHQIIFLQAPTINSLSKSGFWVEILQMACVWYQIPSLISDRDDSTELVCYGDPQNWYTMIQYLWKKIYCSGKTIQISCTSLGLLCIILTTVFINLPLLILTITTSNYSDVTNKIR